MAEKAEKFSSKVKVAAVTAIITMICSGIAAPFVLHRIESSKRELSYAFNSTSLISTTFDSKTLKIVRADGQPVSKPTSTWVHFTCSGTVDLDRVETHLRFGDSVQVLSSNVVGEIKGCHIAVDEDGKGAKVMIQYLKAGASMIAAFICDGEAADPQVLSDRTDIVLRPEKKDAISEALEQLFWIKARVALQSVVATLGFFVLVEIVLDRKVIRMLMRYVTSKRENVKQ